MRHFTILFSLLFCLFLFINSSAQNFSSLSGIQFKTEAEYEEYTDQVLDCCYYLVQTPFNKKDTDRKAASDFIERWVDGTPNYTLRIDYVITEITEDREDLISIYKACYIKLLLEQKEDQQGKSLLNLSLKSFLSYCSDSSNKVKMTKEMKRIKKNQDLVISE